jgi:hypothetical protein
MELEPAHHHAGALMLSILRIILQFILAASDPHETL